MNYLDFLPFLLRNENKQRADDWSQINSEMARGEKVYFDKVIDCLGKKIARNNILKRESRSRIMAVMSVQNQSNNTLRTIMENLPNLETTLDSYANQEQYYEAAIQQIRTNSIQNELKQKREFCKEEIARYEQMVENVKQNFEKSRAELLEIECKLQHMQELSKKYNELCDEQDRKSAELQSLSGI